MDRAGSPVVAVALLVALTVAGAATVGAATLALDAPEAPTAPERTLTLSVDAGADRLVVRHHAGPPLYVASLSLRVTVDGTPLAHQPPVPFFAATGFRAGPTGPFNSGGDGTLSADERAGLWLASTNDPGIHAGDTVTLRVRSNGTRVARLQTRAS